MKCVEPRFAPAIAAAHLLALARNLQDDPDVADGRLVGIMQRTIDDLARYISARSELDPFFAAAAKACGPMFSNVGPVRE